MPSTPEELGLQLEGVMEALAALSNNVRTLHGDIVNEMQNAKTWGLTRQWNHLNQAAPIAEGAAAGFHVAAGECEGAIRLILQCANA